MKNKNVAALLALFGGIFGVHRFYLGQVGLGILYCILSIVGLSVILGVLDGIIFLTMDEEVFDQKYNRKFNTYRDRRYRPDFDRYDRRRTSTRGNWQPKEYEPRSRSRENVQKRAQRPAPPKNNPFKQAGIRKFKDFDYEGALKDFQQALQISPNDISIHFNLACTYSLLEKVEEAYHHIDRAVDMGFKDFQKLDTHDALAYVRIQPQWDDFKESGYRLTKQLPPPEKNLLDEDLLLKQIQKLNDLKEKGLITEVEYITQKKKLMS